VLFFGVWLLGSHLIIRWAGGADESRHGIPRLQKASAAGILVYVLTMSFASIDWVMSLSPHWYSTIFGLLAIVGQVLTALSVTCIVIVVLSAYRPLHDALTERHLHDLGNLVLTFVLLWAYMSFSQFLLIWSADLPEEIPFYVARTSGGWEWAAGLLIAFHFALPFVLLLSRQVKRTARTLAIVAGGILLMRWIDLYWVIVPAVRESAFPHWLDITVPVALAAVWLWFFLGQLPRRGLLAEGRAPVGRATQPVTGEA
jgi:hypothetical protein